MKKIITESGTVMFLNGTNFLRAGAKPLINVSSGLDMPEADWAEISFSQEPAIGESFFYYHPVHYGCGSTPVVSIEEVEDI